MCINVRGLRPLKPRWKERFSGGHAPEPQPEGPPQGILLGAMPPNPMGINVRDLRPLKPRWKSTFFGSHAPELLPEGPPQGLR
jgi:hypothetical protein